MRRVAAIADLRLQSVVIGDAEIHQHVDLAHAAVDRQDRTSGIGRGHGSDLSGRGAIERRRSVQIDGAIEIGPVLVHVVGAGEQALRPLRAPRRWRPPGCADSRAYRGSSAAGRSSGRTWRTAPRRRPAGPPDRDVARRQLRRPAASSDRTTAAGRIRSGRSGSRVARESRCRSSIRPARSPGSWRPELD